MGDFPGLEGGDPRVRAVVPDSALRGCHSGLSRLDL